MKPKGILPTGIFSPHWPALTQEPISIEYPDHKTVRIHEPHGSDASEAVKLLIEITGGEVEVKRRAFRNDPVKYVARSSNLAMLFKLAYGGT